MSNSKNKWQEVQFQILQALDIKAEYEALGVEVLASSPTAKGWLRCRAVGRPDSDASGGIHVGDGPLRGRYKDFAGPTPGKTYGLFDFAATVAGRFGGDWKEARRHYAGRAGVKLPNVDEDMTADRLELTSLTGGTRLLYCQHKAGITPEAIEHVGSIGARWPKGLPPEKTNHAIATPMYGEALLDADPIGYHLVAQNPRLKIRKFQGKGHDEAHVKTLTLGSPGLMGADGLNRLPEAEVVIVVEGISDLFAAQAKLDEWRATGVPGRDHVVISGGGCSYHPRAEWVKHFAGKEIWVIFDVGDAKNEGQIGAAVWVSALLPVARCVRNVQLPLGTDGGKNDLRNWFTSDGGRDYDDLVRLARTFEPVEASDPVANVSKHDAILENLGLRVLGEHADSQKVEVACSCTDKIATIHDVDRLTLVRLVQIVGAEAVEEHVHDGKEPQAPKCSLLDVKLAIAEAASKKVFRTDRTLGAGVWEVDDKVAIVKAGEVATLIEPATLERSIAPVFQSRFCDLGAESGEWYDNSTLSRYLAEAQRPEWCQAVFGEAEALFAKWFWRYRQAPTIITSLVISSWVQTVWRWRPLVAITGASDTGKSMLMEDVLAPLFGPLALHAQKPTEAAIRQHMKHHAKPILIDEFEHDAHRQKILELFRTSSRGGNTIRGTADQQGASFGLKHIPWVASIETGLNRQADRNRFIMLELTAVPPELRGTIDLPTTDRLADLGQRLLAVALKHFRAAREMAAKLKALQVPDVPGRVVESFSVPYAMASVIHGQPLVDAQRMMARLLSEWDFGIQQTRDEIDLLQEIFSAEVRVNGSNTSTVSQLLGAKGDHDAQHALARVGIKRFAERSKKEFVGSSGRDCLFIYPKRIRASLLHNTGFREQSIEQFLDRLPNVFKKQLRLGGKEKFTGYALPYTEIERIFNSADNDDEPDADNRQFDCEDEAAA